MSEKEHKNTGERKSEEQFDIVWLLYYVWAKRKFIMTMVGTTLVMALLVYANKPKVYATEASILPMTDGESGNMGSLKGMASVMGVNLGSTSSNGAVITPYRYEEVASSTPIRLRLMNTPLTWSKPKDTVETLYSHIKNDTVKTFVKTLKKYTIQLPSTIISAITPKEKLPAVVMLPEEGDDEKENQSVVLGPTHDAACNWLAGNVTVTLDDDLGLIRIKTRGENPEQCTELAVAVMDEIKKAVSDFKTKDATRNYKSAVESYKAVSEEYDRARNEFFEYSDKHRNLVTERADVEQKKLEDKYNMLAELAKSSQAEVEACRLAILKKTPVFSIVEPAVQPLKKDSPKLMLHILGGLFMGGLLSIGWLIVRVGYLQAFKLAEYKKLYKEYYKQSEEPVSEEVTISEKSSEVVDSKEE